MIDTITEWVKAQNYLTIGLWIALIVVAFFLFWPKKKKTKSKAEDMKKIQENMENLNKIDDESDKQTIKHLEGKLNYIKGQAISVKDKHNELIRMNESLKSKYNKVKKQLELLK